MCSDCLKNHGFGPKKPEGTNSARFGVRTATKCCDLKLCADRVRSRTQERESLRRQISVRNLNISPSTFTVYILHIFSQVSNCRTTVLLNKLKLLKKPLFQEMAFSSPRSSCLGIPLPLPLSLFGRTYVR